MTSSSTASHSLITNSYRSLRVSNNWSTKISGADAPAVIPNFLTPLNQLASTASIDSARIDFGQPDACATSTSLVEFDELEAPITITASHILARLFTAAWLFVVA